MLILDEDVGLAAAGATAELPPRFEFEVLRLVALVQQPDDALQNDEILVRREVAGGGVVDDQAIGDGILDLAGLQVDPDRGRTARPDLPLAAGLESKCAQSGGEVFCRDHAFVVLDEVALIVARPESIETCSAWA